jgi:hypothetical protein
MPGTYALVVSEGFARRSVDFPPPATPAATNGNMGAPGASTSIVVDECSIYLNSTRGCRGLTHHSPSTNTSCPSWPSPPHPACPPWPASGQFSDCLAIQEQVTHGAGEDGPLEGCHPIRVPSLSPSRYRSKLMQISTQCRTVLSLARLSAEPR